MNINLADPRVKKTRKGLRTAFFTLLKKEGYDAVTIQGIAIEADVARITFYRHYRDKEDLLTDCLNTLFDEILDRASLNDTGDEIIPEKPIRILFEHLEANEKLYKILLSSRGGDLAVKRLQSYLVNKILETFDEISSDKKPDIPNELIAEHLVSAQIGLGIWWIENDKPYPIDYMIDIANWLSFAGIFRSLGYKQFDLPAPKHKE